MFMRTAIIPCALLVLLAAAPATQPTIGERSNALAAEWAGRFKDEGFHSTVAGPFVIAGNLSDAQLARYRDGTILASQRALSAMYFKTPIDRPILILLFADADTYQRLAAKWFNDKDVPHYGFYRHHDRTMLMNISTGGGTLVHELVHAMIAPDFPDVPDWFNEGLASLYEQSTFTGDTIKGLPNWRLPALQKAIRADTLRPLAELIEDDNFRDDKLEGINYAQARYLMQYLQDHQKLTQFYMAFRDGHLKDLTGLATLKATVAPQSLDDFEKSWRAWVLSLRFE